MEKYLYCFQKITSDYDFSKDVIIRQVFILWRGEISEMEKVKYKASCPICGRNLFRGVPDSYIEGYCPKCGNFLMIHFGTDGVNTVAGAREMISKIKK